MKIKIKLRDTTTREEWTEDYDRPNITSQYSAKIFAQHVVEMWNDSYAGRPYPREVVSVKLVRSEVA